MRLRELVIVVAVASAAAWSGALGQTMPMEHAHRAAAASTSLVLTVDGKATTLSVADLQALPQKTVTVENAHSKTTETYSGVGLGELLAKYGAPLEKHEKAMYRSYVLATGTDGYSVLYSASEVEEAMHKGEVIVATMQGGKPLGEDGQMKLVASEDKKPARWVRNLSAITLKMVE